MKNIISLLSLLLTLNLFSQNTSVEKSSEKQNYSENSKITVIYSDSQNNLRTNRKPAAVFVNGEFIGNQKALNFINFHKIEDLKIEKEEFRLNGTDYYGKFLVEMKSDYRPKFLTLNELRLKYLKLDTNPIIYQIETDVISNSNDVILLDEKFILKIVVDKVKTSEKNTEINYIKIITKTPENIKEANTIYIRGIENIKQKANKNLQTEK